MMCARLLTLPSHRVLSTASEALYVTGDFSLLAALVDDPLMRARSFEDKLNILNNLVRALAGEVFRIENAIVLPQCILLTKLA